MNRRAFIGAALAAPTVGVASAIEVVKEPVVSGDVAGGFLIPHEVAVEILAGCPEYRVVWGHVTDWRSLRAQHTGGTPPQER